MRAIIAPQQQPGRRLAALSGHLSPHPRPSTAAGTGGRDVLLYDSEVGRMAVVAQDGRPDLGTAEDPDPQPAQEVELVDLEAHCRALGQIDVLDLQKTHSVSFISNVTPRHSA